ncbi:hypothetical protein [Caldalkalibacillus mannanilyticus]|uniref:hypothetical protein n=1 Tax=Caldalkalibacillus mannanilyticus TaxID=1418 RepID=UPI0005580297|nr:hypothetical protein [Caldalkalibacillus mannanilyticus]
MSSKKEVGKIEAIIDQDFEGLEYWKLSRDAAIILACQLFEEWAFQLGELIQSAPYEQKAELKGKMLDLMQACEWLIKKAFEKCGMDGLTIESDERLLIKYTEEAYSKALIHTKAEQIFMPYWQGLYTATVNNEEEIEFNFPSQRFAIFEGINAVLLDDNNNYKNKKYEKADLSIRNLFGNIPEMVYQTRGMAKVEFDFDFPDDYKIGPYTIGDIKMYGEESFVRLSGQTVAIKKT